MKVFLITWGCDQDDVSESEITYRWVREISRHHDVTLFSVSRPERFGCVSDQFPEIPVIEWCDVRVPTSFERFRAIAKPGYFFYYPKARKFIGNFLKKQHFDLIHHLSPFAWRYASPAYGFEIPLVRGPVAGGLSTPQPLASIVRENLHPYKFLRRTDYLRKRLDRILINSYRHTDCVLLAAPYVHDIIDPLPIKRYEVEIEHGLELEVINKNSKYCKKTVRDGKVKLLFVGRIIRTKGVRDAIIAISHMHSKDLVEFNIIGDGDDFLNCQKEIKKSNLNEFVKLWGWLKKDEVEKFYNESDIFVFPSFREPTGGVLLEAMAHGLPCVACDYGGPGYIVDDDSGILIPPLNPDMYAKKIAEILDRLVTDHNLRSQLGEGAKAHAYRDFQWDSKMERLNKIYHAIV